MATRTTETTYVPAGDLGKIEAKIVGKKGPHKRYPAEIDADQFHQPARNPQEITERGAHPAIESALHWHWQW